MLQLRAHQQKELNYGLTHHRFLLASTMGCGKTITILELLHVLHLRAVIVCPAYLTRNWVNEARKWHPSLEVQAYDKKLTTVSNINTLVVGYEMMVKHASDVFSKRDVIVIDECHYLSCVKTQRTKAVHQYAKKMKHVVLMTGTPMKNKPSDLYSLIKLVQTDDEFSKKFRTFHQFQDYFMNVKVERFGGRMVTNYYGMRNAGELSQWMKKNYIRHTLEDIGEVPVMQSILVEIDELSKTIDAELKAQFDRYEAKAAVVGDHISTVKKANALLKVAATAEFVESIRSLESPVVVFTDHVDSCEELARALKCPMIRGDTPHKARQKIVEDFQGGTLLSCVLTLGAASLGITLHRSNICVFNDLNWVPSTNAQAAARIQRIGQTRKCLAYYLSRTGIDAYITTSLTAKSREIDEVVADKKETLYAEVDAYLSSL